MIYIKKYILIILFFFTLNSCQYNDKIDYNKTLPDNFNINFNIIEVKEQEYANIYSSIIKKFNTNNLTSTILDDIIIELEDLPYGIDYRTENGKYLTIYKNGGFQYTTTIDNEFNFAKKTRVIGGPRYSNGDSQRIWYNYQNKLDYYVEDLNGFPARDRVLREVLELLNAVNVPKVEISEVYSVDKETMNIHNSLYCDYLINIGGSLDEMYDEYTQIDEGYLFYISQDINGIPFLNVLWNGMGNSTTIFGNPMLCISGTAFYGINGISFLSIYNFLEIIESKGEYKLISKENALDYLISYYSDVIISSDIVVVSMSLNYITLENEEPFELRPAWVFEILETSNYNFGEITICKIFVFDAITGEKLNG